MLVYPLTEKAELRPLEPWRAEEFAGFIADNKEHLEAWLPWAEEINDAVAARAFLQTGADKAAADAGRMFGIWVDGVMAGGTLFRVLDTRFSTAEIGVWIAPWAQGQGLITIAAQRMIEWAIVERGFNRVEWRAASANTRSVAVAKRLGMSLDGVLREGFPYRGEKHDIEVWSLLAREWTK